MFQIFQTFRILQICHVFMIFYMFVNTMYSRCSKHSTFQNFLDVSDILEIIILLSLDLASMEIICLSQFLIVFTFSYRRLLLLGPIQFRMVTSNTIFLLRTSVMKYAPLIFVKLQPSQTVHSNPGELRVVLVFPLSQQLTSK